MLSSLSLQEFWWFQWHWHPLLIVLVVLVEGAYLLFIGPLRRLLVWHHLVKPSPNQIIAFSLGILAGFLAEQTPLQELSDQYLLSAHMVQHALLSLLLPPLLLLGTPAWLLRPLLDVPSVNRVFCILVHPLGSFILFNLVFNVGFLPIVMEGALRNHGIHIVLHSLLVFTSLLVWWPILSPLPELPRSSHLMQMLFLFLLALAQTPVFAIMTFSGQVLYPFYADQPRLWGIPPLTDQQIGGVILKVSSTLVYLLALTVIFFSWVRGEERVGQRL